MNAKTVRGYIFAILSAVIFGCMPLMARYIYADGVSPSTLVFLRNFLALPSLAVLAYLQRKSLKVPAKALAPIAAISFFGCCLTPILLFTAYNYIASGTATVFHFIYPAVVVLSGILFLKKKAKAEALISVGLCIIGVALFYDPAQPINLAGSALALGSGITFALYVLLLAGFRHREISGFLFSFYVAAASAVIAFIICIATGQLALPQTVTGWGLCLLFALAVTTGAVFLFQRGTFLIGGEKTSILSTLEPITSIVVGIVVFHEKATFKSVLGAVLVISASVLIAVFDIKKKR